MRVTSILILLISCTSKEVFIPRDITNIKIKHILTDTSLNVRALEINENRMVAATANGSFYSLKINGEDKIQELIYPNYKNDSLFPNNFRSVAFQGNSLYALTIESPAKLYKNGKIVYQENHPNIFYDAMAFWNDQEGIAIGDPTEGCMSILITRNGGETWTKISCDSIPKSKEKEAAFAASNSNISIVENKVWVATGGVYSRIFYSPNKGKTWEVFDTPIIQGTETTGIYSIDFYDTLIGFGIGGDYKNPENHSANKIKTTDGGRSWKLVAENKTPGYRSCIRFVPNRKGKEMVAIGFNGIDYSNDGGTNWSHLSNESYYTLRFVNDSTAYAAGKGHISKLIFQQ
jgi:hypothetical protein